MQRRRPVQCQQFIGKDAINAQSKQFTFKPSQQFVQPGYTAVSNQITSVGILSKLINESDREQDDTETANNHRQWTITFRIKLLSGPHGEWRCLFHYGNTDGVRQSACWVSVKSLCVEN